MTNSYNYIRTTSDMELRFLNYRNNIEVIHFLSQNCDTQFSLNREHYLII